MFFQGTFRFVEKKKEKKGKNNIYSSIMMCHLLLLLRPVVKYMISYDSLLNPWWNVSTSLNKCNCHNFRKSTD